MKIRNGFVSNSSTSSFACVICEEIESGMDIDLSGVEMRECDRCGSVFHEECVADHFDMGGELSQLSPFENTSSCPVCRLEFLSDYDELSYLRIKCDLNNASALEEIQTKFANDYDKLMEFFKVWRDMKKEKS